MPTKTLHDVTVADVYLHLLADRGVDYLFANAGTDFAPIVEALAKAEALGTPHPQPITCPHENTAQHMAIGYYLVTRRPQLTMHHVNVGTANAMTGLLNAARGNVPILFTAGRTPINEEGIKGHRANHIHWTQEMYDQASMVRESVKWDYELRNSQQVATVIDRMISMAMTPPEGPVYLSLPREVLAQHVDEYTFDSPTRVNPAPAPWPDPAALEQAAQVLARAQNPMIITNWGGRNPRLMPELVDFAERYAIPVVEYRGRYVAMPPRHPMNAGFNPVPLVKEADAILVIDTAVPWLPAQVKPKEDCTVIQMAVDPLYSFVPIRGFPADIVLTCTGDTGLRLLGEAMGEHAAANSVRIGARRDECHRRHEGIEEAWEAKLQEGRESNTITNAYLSHCVNQIRTDDAIVVKESPLEQHYIDADKPMTVIDAGAASGLGNGMGVALGAKLADRDRMVIGTEGDGAYMFNTPISAHYVSAAHDLPILTVIFNNQRWDAVKNSTFGMEPDGYANKADTPPLVHFTVEQHYEKLVEVSGGYGVQVTDPKDLLPALERAAEVVMVDKRQAVVNVFCEVDEPIERD